MNLAFERRSFRLGPAPFGPASLAARRGGLGVPSLLLSLGLLAAGVFSGRQAMAGQNSGEKEISTQEVQSTFKVQVQRNMVVLRAIVRDPNGHPVANLRKEDFRLWDNGKPQEIEQFAVESPDRIPALAPPAPTGEESEEGAASGARQASITARNFQALYFDDVQMSNEDVARARDAADHYLANTLTAADRAGIFTSSGQGNLDFTDDRSKLHEALFKLRSRPVIETDRCPDIGNYQAYLIAQRHDPDAADIALFEYMACNCQVDDKMSAQICVNQGTPVVQSEAMEVLNHWETQSEAVMRGLEQIIRRVALLPGKRSVIFLSPGFLFYNLESQIAEVTDRALRSNVVVSTLDPRGLYVINPAGDASHQNITPLNRPDLRGKKQQIIEQGISLDEQVLYGFAEDTGGQFFHNSNDLDQGFRQVGTLSEVYYVLAFSPHNLKYDGRFHTLKVRLVNPAGSTLQARRGYFAPKASEDPATRAKEEIKEAVFSQDELKELPIDVHTQFYKVNEAEVRLAVLTHLDLSSVHFRQEQDRHLDNLTFLTVVFDRDGKCVVAKEKRVEFHLRDATLSKLSQTGITMKTEVDLKPGTYLVRQIVRDSEAGQLSGLSHTVEIPY